MTVVWARRPITLRTTPAPGTIRSSRTKAIRIYVTTCGLKPQSAVRLLSLSPRYKTLRSMSLSMLSTNGTRTCNMTTTGICCLWQFPTWTTRQRKSVKTKAPVMSSANTPTRNGPSRYLTVRSKATMPSNSKKTKRTRTSLLKPALIGNRSGTT